MVIPEGVVVTVNSTWFELQCCRALLESCKTFIIPFLMSRGIPMFTIILFGNPQEFLLVSCYSSLESLAILVPNDFVSKSIGSLGLLIVGHRLW